MSSVLIVDDEPSIRRSVRRMLEQAGHVVMEAASGIDALCLLEQNTPDILVTDLHMPDVNGFELARAVRKSGRPQPKVIILSGDDAKYVFEQAVAVGATALLKPFTMDELLAAVALAGTPPARPIRILVVDDQPDVCLGFRYMLETEHFNVTDAFNGRQALACLAREPVDVILTDLSMPEMDGLAFLGALRTASSPRPLTIAMTGSALLDREKALEQAQMLGANAILQKPISRAQLLSTIHCLIDRDPTKGPTRQLT